MNAATSTFDEELARRTDEVLHYVWDPAGVSNSPVARHDYDDFLPAILTLLRDGKSADAIATHLDALEENEFGLEADTEMTGHVADILVEWRELLRAKFP
ncbi:MAG: hypothetical protein IT492_13130 [Gammaproteobacteria bacterium]|nr:hypothetical protein [Gammaproteobacteria bacterium]